MDNQRPAHSGPCLFVRNALYALALVIVAAHLQADTSVNESKMILNAQQSYTAELPDYFSRAIPFRWHYQPAGDHIPSAMGSLWHHNYNLRLLQNEEKLELVKPDGTRQLFSPIDGQHFVADESPNETIEHRSQHYHLTTLEMTATCFGSYPVEIKQTNQFAIKLRYKNGVLSRLFDTNANMLLLSYSNNGALTEITQTDGASITFEYDQYDRLAASRSSQHSQRIIYPSSPPVVLCTAVTSNPQQQTPQQQSNDQTCDVNQNPPPSSYQLSQLNPNSIKIDLRPQSCRSYFVDYNGIDRGVKLEAGMLTHVRYNNLIATVRSFPVVDFIDGREAIAVYTKDLTSKTYNAFNHPNGLYQSIIQDAQKVDDKFLSKLQTAGSVSAKEKGITTTITSSQVDTLRMEVMIQAGAATPLQLAQIERARVTLLSQWNIKLVTVIIP